MGVVYSQDQVGFNLFVCWKQKCLLRVCVLVSALVHAT